MLEIMVAWDMLKNGYNPTDPIDIKKYWEEKLK